VQTFPVTGADFEFRLQKRRWAAHLSLLPTELAAGRW
jgi:hypothetical protein